MTKRRPFLTHLKDWWWLYGVGSTLIGVIVLWASIPGRVAKAEAKVEQVEEQNITQDRILDRLTYVAEQNQKIQTQQVANQAAPVVEEVTDDGEIKVLVVDGIKLCCNGTECWRWEKHDKCVRHE